jgi:hypothetical protein
LKRQKQSRHRYKTATISLCKSLLSSLNAPLLSQIIIRNREKRAKAEALQKEVAMDFEAKERLKVQCFYRFFTAPSFSLNSSPLSLSRRSDCWRRKQRRRRVWWRWKRRKKRRLSRRHKSERRLSVWRRCAKRHNCKRRRHRYYTHKFIRTFPFTYTFPLTSSYPTSPLLPATRQSIHSRAAKTDPGNARKIIITEIHYRMLYMLCYMLDLDVKY